MSGSLGPLGLSDFGRMNGLVANGAVVRQKLDRLTGQASSGLVGDTYAGLGSGASISLSLRPQIGNLQTWQSNIDVATGRMAVAQSALRQVQSIAASFYAQLDAVDGINASAVDSIAASARDALGQVAQLLDAQDGGVYVFGGQDTANAPVPAPGNILNSGFFTQIRAAVTGLAGNAGAVAQATYNVALSNVAGTSPFSGYMSQGSNVLRTQLPIVQVGQTTARNIGLLASANALIPDSPLGSPAIPGGPPVAPPPLTAGPPSTGSYVRDLLRGLATIGSLSSTQVNTPGFQDLVQDTRASMFGAIGTMATDVGVLGDTQSSLATTKAQLVDTETALTGQTSAVEDVDMAAILSQLSLVQTQMQASYQLIASMGNLSLVKYL